jgi:nucleoside phosphorylase
MACHSERIGLILATHLEADPIIEALGLHPVRRKPFACFAAQSLLTIVSGIGKTLAAAATSYLLTGFPCRMLINFGAAGALQPEAALGTPCIVNRLWEPDRIDLTTMRPPDQSIESAGVVSGLDLKAFHPASLATRDRPTVSQQDRSAIRLSDYSGIQLTDMEGAAIYQTAACFQTPCVLLKFISDSSMQPNIVDNIIHLRLSACQMLLQAGLREYCP